MPATFGLAAANHVLCKLAQYPLEYLPGQTRFRPQFYGQVVNQLVAVESRIRNNLPGLKVPVSEADAGYIVEEVFGGKSVVSGLSTRLALVRWQKPRGEFIDKRTPGQNNSLLRMNELVCMTKEEAAKHEKEVLMGGKMPGEVWDGKVVEAVRAKMEEEEKYERFR